jgi:hypothetical protein
MKKGKTYPNRVLEDALIERGIPRQLMWDMPGPKHTAIAWISCYLVNSHILHVVTYRDNCGWDVLVSVSAMKIPETIDEVISRTKGG